MKSVSYGIFKTQVREKTCACGLLLKIGVLTSDMVGATGVLKSEYWDVDAIVAGHKQSVVLIQQVPHHTRIFMRPTAYVRCLGCNKLNRLNRFLAEKL